MLRYYLEIGHDSRFTYTYAQFIIIFSSLYSFYTFFWIVLSSYFYYTYLGNLKLITNNVLVCLIPEISMRQMVLRVKHHSEELQLLAVHQRFLMIILSYFYTHSLFTVSFLLNYMFQSNTTIIRFECKFEVIVQKLYYYFIFPILSEVIMI
jgi:hypothetical protein